MAKGVEETEWQIFLRAVGCNWLVCLAVWMAFAAEDVAGKILAIFFPIMAFVAMGFDHVVANMFFLPAAIFAGVDGITGGTRSTTGSSPSSATSSARRSSSRAPTGTSTPKDDGRGRGRATSPRARRPSGGSSPRDGDRRARPRASAERAAPTEQAEPPDRLGPSAPHERALSSTVASPRAVFATDLVVARPTSWPAPTHA